MTDRKYIFLIRAPFNDDKNRKRNTSDLSDNVSSNVYNRIEAKFEANRKERVSMRTESDIADFSAGFLFFSKFKRENDQEGGGKLANPL